MSDQQDCLAPFTEDAAKGVWDRPELRRLDADEAQVAPTPNPDGPTAS